MDTLDEIAVAFSAAIQKAVLAEMEKFAEDANRLGFSLNNAAYMIGVSVASQLFEAIKKQDQVVITAEEEKALRVCAEDMKLGFEDRLAKLSDPTFFKEAGISPEVH